MRLRVDHILTPEEQEIGYEKMESYIRAQMFQKIVNMMQEKELVKTLVTNEIGIDGRICTKIRMETVIYHPDD